ncbi:MAG: efflux RND transporter periplasmic adaptor subunit [Bacteroides sp.]|nr:efflux RND transporter periplasmic adaptor subunit [Ruminococcus flavefaciens]MCM1554208.1 efflux RND transporter periplasmic adaptor subunit [Bacteroides sp.]
MKRKQVLIWTGIVVLVAATAFLIVRKSGGKAGKATYETQVIGRGDMENSVTATGTVEPMEQVEVGTQVSGIIDKIHVDYNSKVKKGEVIAELDKTVLQAELETARLSVESNRNEFNYQEKNYRRNKQLYDKKLISDSEIETAEYNYHKAKIAYEQSLAQEVKARTNLGYATIYSPIDGIVISKAVEVGQTVASSFSTPTLFTIADDLHRIQVVADVDEADIGQVEEGAEVTFSVDAYPDERFEGKVNQVRMEAVTTNNVVTYEVVIHAENPDLKLKPGLTANINIYSMRRQNVLRLPVKATKFRPAERPDFKDRPEPKGRPESGDTMHRRPPFPKDSAMRPHRGPRPGDSMHRRPPFPHGERPFMEDSADSDIKLVFVMGSAEGSDEPVLQPRKVRVGVSDRIYYEVLGGLGEGEQVCVGMGSANTKAMEMGSAQRSPFMPGPPGRGNNRKK